MDVAQATLRVQEKLDALKVSFSDTGLDELESALVDLRSAIIAVLPRAYDVILQVDDVESQVTSATLAQERRTAAAEQAEVHAPRPRLKAGP